MRSIGQDFIQREDENERILARASPQLIVNTTIFFDLASG